MPVVNMVVVVIKKNRKYISSAGSNIFREKLYFPCSINNFIDQVLK